MSKCYVRIFNNVRDINNSKASRPGRVGPVHLKSIQFNLIYLRNTTGINTVLNLRSNKKYVPIIFNALIISFKHFVQNNDWSKEIPNDCRKSSGTYATLRWQSKLMTKKVINRKIVSKSNKLILNVYYKYWIIMWASKIHDTIIYRP